MGVVAVGDVRNRRLHGPALVGGLLLAKPVITQKPKLDITDIALMGEGHPVQLDNSVQNRLRF
ncbi:hypothetical protein ACIQVL_44150 [Streptomyces sp. NPDC090499]|uniref:hypothetical protein n=1 Tax=Streptomyces sp. NPDC090499 TaxID=3365965 RepID=UPI003818DD2E